METNTDNTNGDNFANPIREVVKSQIKRYIHMKNPVPGKVVPVPDVGLAANIKLTPVINSTRLVHNTPTRNVSRIFQDNQKENMVPIMSLPRNMLTSKTPVNQKKLPVHNTSGVLRVIKPAVLFGKNNALPKSPYLLQKLSEREDESKGKIKKGRKKNTQLCLFIDNFSVDDNIFDNFGITLECCDRKRRLTVMMYLKECEIDTFYNRCAFMKMNIPLSSMKEIIFGKCINEARIILKHSPITSNVVFHRTCKGRDIFNTILSGKWQSMRKKLYDEFISKKLQNVKYIQFKTKTYLMFDHIIQYIGREVKHVSYEDRYFYGADEIDESLALSISNLSGVQFDWLLNESLKKKNVTVAQLIGHYNTIEKIDAAIKNSSWKSLVLTKEQIKEDYLLSRKDMFKNRSLFCGVMFGCNSRNCFCSTDKKACGSSCYCVINKDCCLISTITMKCPWLLNDLCYIDEPNKLTKLTSLVKNGLQFDCCSYKMAFVEAVDKFFGDAGTFQHTFNCPNFCKDNSVYFNWCSGKFIPKAQFTTLLHCFNCHKCTNNNHHACQHCRMVLPCQITRCKINILISPNRRYVNRNWSKINFNLKTFRFLFRRDITIRSFRTMVKDFISEFNFHESCSSLEESLINSMDSTYRNTCEFESCSTNRDIISLSYGRMGFIGKSYAWHDFELVSIVDDVDERLEIPRICRADFSMDLDSSDSECVPLMLLRGPINASPPREIEGYITPSGVVCQRGLQKEVAAAQTSYSIDRSMAIVGVRDIYQQNYLPNQVVVRPTIGFEGEKCIFKGMDAGTNSFCIGEQLLLTIVMRYSCPTLDILQHIIPWNIDYQAYLHQVKQGAFGTNWWKSYPGKMPVLQEDTDDEENVTQRSKRRALSNDHESLISNPTMVPSDITILENATMVAEQMYQASFVDHSKDQKQLAMDAYHSSNTDNHYASSNTISIPVSAKQNYSEVSPSRQRTITNSDITNNLDTTSSPSATPICPKLTHDSVTRSTPSVVTIIPANYDVIMGMSGHTAPKSNKRLPSIIKKPRKQVEFKKIKIVDILREEEPDNNESEDYELYNKDNLLIGNFDHSFVPEQKQRSVERSVGIDLKTVTLQQVMDNVTEPVVQQQPYIEIIEDGSQSVGDVAVYTDSELAEAIQFADNDQLPETYDLVEGTHVTCADSTNVIQTEVCGDEILNFEMPVVNEQLDSNLELDSNTEEILEFQEDVDYAKDFTIDEYVAEVLPTKLEDIMAGLPGNLPAEIIDAYEDQHVSQEINTTEPPINPITIDSQSTDKEQESNGENKWTSENLGMCPDISNGKQCQQTKKSWDIDKLMDQLIGIGS